MPRPSTQAQPARSEVVSNPRDARDASEGTQSNINVIDLAGDKVSVSVEGLQGGHGRGHKTGVNRFRRRKTAWRRRSFRRKYNRACSYYAGSGWG